MQSKKIILITIILAYVSGLNAQTVTEFDGQVKISLMAEDNNADSIVVILPDGSLGFRDAQTVTNFQVLSISNDTIYLENGGFVKLPTSSSNFQYYYPDRDQDGFGNSLFPVYTDNPLAGYVLDNTDCDDEEMVGSGSRACVVYFYDQDGDEFGLSSNSRCLCSPSGFYTALAPGDCNDNNPLIYPGADEICDGIDNNCNSSRDEGIGNTGCTIYYYDGDEDNFGVTANSRCLCAPSGFYTATVGGDCNDGNDQIYPNAFEFCNDGIDHNCNGSTSDCDLN